MARKTKRVFHLQYRDIGILNSLWRWKVSTTAAIAEEFFGGRFVDAAYLRLRKLARAGLIGFITIPETTQHLWSLKRPGLDRIKHRFPENTQLGIEIEYPWHDLLCAALHRGPWPSEDSNLIERCSEQELRRVCYRTFFNEIPSTDIHRPDGYTFIKGEGDDSTRLIAFEVELHRKRRREYEMLSTFYQYSAMADLVVWLVPNEFDARWLLGVLSSSVEKASQCHAFLLLEDFVRLGWGAPVFVGKGEGKPLASILELGTSPAFLNGELPALLDLRKRPYRSVRSSSDERKVPFNRVPYIAPSSLTPDLEPPGRSL